MKNIRKAIPAVALLVALNGCAVGNESPEVETQVPTETILVQMETEPTVLETYAEEETVQVRESEEVTEPAFEATPTVIQTEQRYRENGGNSLLQFIL